MAVPVWSSFNIPHNLFTFENGKVYAKQEIGKYRALLANSKN